MNRDLVDKIARAVLYEGYILYPYRPSVKSQQRWTFGGLYPQSWTDAQSAGDPSFMQTECLVEGTDEAVLRVNVRFLHLINRTVGELSHPADALPDNGEPAFSQAPSITIDKTKYYPWQEAEERDVDTGEYAVKDLLDHGQEMSFRYPASRKIELLRRADGTVPGLLLRVQHAIDGRLILSAKRVENRLFKISVTIRNCTSMEMAANAQRDDALMRSLVSTHAILGIAGGEFISLTDPPDSCKSAACACCNVGNWPVLVGTEPDRDMLLASPIILYDYPQIAPESPGDLFDGLEIDEILSLRILTLTDEEKTTAAGVDEKARQVLERTESLAREQLMGLHGTMRGMQPIPQEPIHG